MRLFNSGEQEPLKIAVHGSLLALVAVCAGYNAIAFCLRRDRHLAFNVAVYGALVALEVRQVKRHMEAR